MRSTFGWKSGSNLRQAPVWAGMAAIAALSWFYLARLGASMAAMGGGTSAHTVMAMGDAGASSLAAVLAMWAVMMMAMMLPSVAPSAAVFSALATRRDPQRGASATAIYVAGYAAAWIGFAVFAALMQWALTHFLLLDPMARSTSALLSATILLGAGLYQFTPLKTACLSKCRSPLAFFMAQWRDGAVGALGLGLQHGSYCVACCWALMAVMFVVGAMNLVWMGLITLLLLGEKVIPAGWRFDRAVGATLVASSLYIVANAWWLH
jgi:predicted metal-binding membrane protein